MKNQRNVVSHKSFYQTFFKKFAEFEAEPQGFYTPRVFLEVWKLFTIKKVSNFSILHKFFIELTLIISKFQLIVK